jgi:hypothetical protein
LEIIGFTSPLNELEKFLVQGDLFEWAAQQDESEVGFAARCCQ